jgi:hypothetical protein
LDTEKVSVFLKMFIPVSRKWCGFTDDHFRPVSLLKLDTE